MCGIVGLLVKNPAMRSQLGELMVPIFEEMAARGPESAGLAVFTERLPETDRKYSLYAPTWDYDWAPFEADFIRRFGTEAQMAVKGNHAVLTCDEPVGCGEGVDPPEPSASCTCCPPGVASTSTRTRGIRPTSRSATRFRQLIGTHVVGHTRMATESAVTPDRAHPFTAGEDFCLVHNGSLSNPFMIRRKLEHKGIKFETDNDTEAACRFLEWRMREGDTLEGGAAEGLRGARRLLHVPDRHREQAGAGARCLRLQAGGRGRDRRLRGHLVRVSLAGASAGRQEREAVRADAGGDLRMDSLAVERRADHGQDASISPRRRCAS